MGPSHRLPRMPNMATLLIGWTGGLLLLGVAVRVRNIRTWTARRLRRLSVPTLLSAAGVLVSAAALAVIIGIGSVQIQAGHGGSGDLFANPWFDVGIFLGGLALLVGIIAISASATQAIAISAFPDVTIRVTAMGRGKANRPMFFGIGPETPMEMYRIKAHIVNNERTRNVNLSVILHFRMQKGAFEGAKVCPFSSVNTDRAGAIVFAVPGQGEPVPLLQPIHLGPGQSQSGDLYYEAGPPFSDAIDWQTTGWIQVTENISETVRTYPLDALGNLTASAPEV